MRLVYLGTPAMAVPPLEALVEAGHEVVLVVSGPDKRRGRGRSSSPSPVKAAALAAGLPVSDDPDDVLGVKAELGVVVAYGRILRPHLLAHLPMVNLHFSLLPRWRGAAPVERAILAGDAATGVCVMEVEETLDTGGVYAQAEVPIGERTTAEELRAELVRIGSKLLVEVLASGLGEPRPQSTVGITYAEKLTAEDRHLDFNQPATQVHRVVRVGGAWTTFRGKRLKVIAADLTDGPLMGPPGRLHKATVACGDGGGLVLCSVQPEGRAVMDAEAFLRGARPEHGELLGR